MDTTTINGLHKCQPKNAPTEGDIKNMVVLNMPAKGDKKAWIKIKNELPDKGGSPYRILGVSPLDWPPDNYGNIAFNLEVEASSSQPTAFQKTRETMQQGRVPRDDDTQVYKREELLHEPDSDWPEAQQGTKIEPESPPARQNVDSGVQDARKHLMQSANLLNLCVDAVNKSVAPYVPEIAQTSEFFQAQVATLFIEASRAGFVSKMPESPIK